MEALAKQVRQFVRDEDGPTATEYAVMMSMIILVVFGTVGVLGTTVASKLVIPGW